MTCARQPWRDGLRLYSISQGRSIATTRTNVYAARFYAAWCERQGIALCTATTDDITRFVIWYRERTSQFSVVRRLSSIKFLYKYLVAEGVRDDNPAAPIRLRQPKAPIKEPFTEEELRALVSATENLRDRAIILMFIATGCRISEILSMRSADVSWESGSILVRGKGQRHRYVIPGRLAMKALDRYLDGRTGALWINYFGDPLCQPGCYLMIRNLGERVGVKAYPHRFRTTFACMFNRLSNGDIQSLQILMGHAKVSTTLHYAAHGAVQRALEQQRRLSLADRVAG